MVEWASGRSERTFDQSAAIGRKEPLSTNAATVANVRFSGRGSQPFRILFDPFLSQTISVPQLEATRCCFAVKLLLCYKGLIKPTQK